jgi:ATP-dependent protease ClpP protease subunit
VDDSNDSSRPEVRQRQLAEIFRQRNDLSRRRQQREGDGWYKITASAGAPASVSIYGNIGFGGISAQDFIRDLAAVSGPIEIHLNSPGGDVFEAYAIYTALVSRPGVTTIVDALAASGASLILMAGESRLMAMASQVMVHDAWAGIDGDAAEMAAMAARLEQTSGQMAGIYGMTAGGAPDYWRGLMRATTWFTPEEALAVGLATGIIGAARQPVPAGAGSAAMDPAGSIAAASLSSTPAGRQQQMVAIEADRIRAARAREDAAHMPGNGVSALGRAIFWEGRLDENHEAWSRAHEHWADLKASAGLYPTPETEAAIRLAELERGRLGDQCSVARQLRDEADAELHSVRLGFW